MAFRGRFVQAIVIGASLACACCLAAPAIAGETPDTAAAAPDENASGQGVDARALPSAARYDGASIRHQSLSRIAKRFVGSLASDAGVSVACWSNGDWPSVTGSDGLQLTTLGVYLSEQPDWIHLGPTTCRSLDALLAGRSVRPSSIVAEAITTLAHELLHATGVRREALAECRALQLTGRLGRMLGVVRGDARILSLRALENYDDLPAGYVDRLRCRESGEWDMNARAPSSPWLDASSGGGASLRAR